MSEDHQNPIQSFYNDSNILITGGTGFLGRVLIEKLLRSCPNVSTIYLMIRKKRGKNLSVRLDELFEDIIFDEMKKICPDFRRKVVGIEGDCCLPELGVSNEDRQTLISKVNIVFHAAATVSFDEEIKKAVRINVSASRFLIQIAKEMKNLKVFIYVSTCYSNCVLPLIKEKVYSTLIDVDELIKLVENSAEEFTYSMTHRLLGEWPNTYTFTKAVAENLLSKNALNIPAVIFRPSIIVSTYKEPIVGWLNNSYGPAGISTAVTCGILRTLNCDGTINANMVPVDMCVNALIAVAYEVGLSFHKTKHLKRNDIPVYHYESSEDQPITWDRFMKVNLSYCRKNPFMNAQWHPTLSLQKNRFRYLLTVFITHIIPACIVDIGLILLSRKPQAMTVYGKIHKLSNVLSYFCLRTFIFESKKMRNIIESMSEKDKQIFPCDLKQLDWDEFFEEYIKGIRIYLMKDDMSTLGDALVKSKRLQYLHRGLKIILTLIGVSVICTGIYAVFKLLL